MNTATIDKVFFTDIHSPDQLRDGWREFITPSAGRVLARLVDGEWRIYRRFHGKYILCGQAHVAADATCEEIWQEYRHGKR